MFKFISNAGDDEPNGMVGRFVVLAPGAAPAAPVATRAVVAPATGASVGRDGQSLASQSGAGQAMFRAVGAIVPLKNWSIAVERRRRRP
jgi:hypothetical protein